MEKLIVEGGHPLQGIVHISGSKNSSLPILAATLLTADTCVIRNVPDLSDTNLMTQMIGQLGAEVERASGKVTIKAEKIQCEAPYELVRRMRASICVMGPLTGRLKRAVVSLPGGCVIGDRPVDLHLKGLSHLGAYVHVEGGDIRIEAGKGLKGCEMNLRGPHGSTVLGTGNIMMAATLADGVTVIDGAATEPEVVDLADFLIKMGAKIEGAGTSRITVEGVAELHGAEHDVIPDRIEAGTFLVVGCMPGVGQGIEVRDVWPAHLQIAIDKLRHSGHDLEVGSDWIRVRPGKKPLGNDLVTEVYSGFPTDMQAQFGALLCVTPGVSRITETIFPQRFMYTSELKRLGADVQLDGATATITGVEKLSAAPVMASDLRASAALVIAALVADGSTEINRLYHIDRGYEHIDRKLKSLGARMQRVRVG